LGFFNFADMKHFIFFFISFNTFFVSAQDSTVIIQNDSSIVMDTIQKTEEIIRTVVPRFETAVIDSQLIQTVNPKRKKITIDRVRIMFGFNFSPYSPLVIESDEFRSVYYPVKDSAPVFAERNTKSNLSKTYKTSNIQFFLQANVWKGLFVGMNYQFFSVKNYKKDPNLGNLLSKKSATFFLVSASFGYVFEFLKNKNLQLQPSLRIGGYTADDYYDSGLGKKFYLGAECKIRYLIKGKAGFSLGADYDFLRYKKKGYSDIFQRDTYQKTTFSNVSLNLGFCYNVSIKTRKK
jgi:hypothetical protein